MTAGLFLKKVLQMKSSLLNYFLFEMLRNVKVIFKNDSMLKMSFLFFAGEQHSETHTKISLVMFEQ